LVLSLIIVAVIVSGFLYINSLNHNGSGYGSDSNSYEEKVMTVEEIEQSQPTKFLEADGSYNENFWGGKIKVHGTITNNATVAIYKDAIVRITYYTKTKTVLGSEDYTIYEVFFPRVTKTFELKIINYQNVNSIGWEVIDAEIY